MIKKLFPSKKEAQRFLLDNAFLPDCKGDHGRQYYKAKPGIYKNQAHGYVWKSPFTESKGLFQVVIYGVEA
jgi:hypothetical protein